MRWGFTSLTRLTQRLPVTTFRFAASFFALVRSRLPVPARPFRVRRYSAAAAQRFKEGARAHVVGELFVGFVFSAFGDRDEKFFVKRGEPAFDAAQLNEHLRAMAQFERPSAR
jgi:hypothetical protein